MIVGCEPADLEEQIGLSDVASAAAEEAVRIVCELVEHGRAVVGESRDTVDLSES